MRIGITFDLKEESLASGGRQPPGFSPCPDAGPDDLHEEFDSPATVQAIAAALRDLGHDVVKLGDGRELLKYLLADPPDLVFNIAEGQGIGRSREARVPAVLEMLGIPYTGSDPLTLAVTLDKDCAKRLVSTAGIAVPQGTVVANGELVQNSKLKTQDFSFPVIVKPAWEGSSKGIRSISILDRPTDLPRVVERLQHDYQQPVLVEEFIDGDEVTVGVLGNAPPQVIGIMRVLPRQAAERFIYSLDVKRDWRRLVRYECPAALEPHVLDAIREAALESYRVLGCRDIARIDFRLRDGVPYFLEANPLPGLNPDSGDIVILSRSCGWPYDRLIAAMLECAVQRCDFANSRKLRGALLT